MAEEASNLHDNRNDPNAQFVAGCPVDDSCVSLSFFGDSLVPEEISRSMGCEASLARRKGDTIQGKTTQRIAKTGSWHLKGTLPKETDLEAQVAGLLGAVTDDLAVWHRLTVQFDVCILCGVFMNKMNQAVTLSPQIMQMLSERGLQIVFEIYAGDDDR